MLSLPAGSFLSRNPVFRNFLTASTISLLGSGIFDIAMPLYVLQRTESVVALSMVNFCLTLPFFLMAPFTGYSVDNFDKRRIMLYSDIGQILCLSFLFLYEVTSAESLWPILVAVFTAKSLTLMFETVSTFQLIPALVSPEDLSSANTWFLASHRIVQIFGPLTGGLLLSAFGVRSCILVNILSFGATVYFTYRLKHLNALILGDAAPVPPRDFRVSDFIENFRESMRYVVSSPIFKPFVALMFFWNFSSLLPNSPSVMFYLTKQAGFSPAQYGLVVSLCGIMGIAGYMRSTTAYRGVDFPRIFVGASFWQATLSSLAVIFSPIPMVFVGLFGISRVGSSILTMGTFLLRQTRIPKAKIGGVNSCIRMLFMSAVPLSALVQAFLIERFGVQTALVTGALCLWATLTFAKKVGEATRKGKPRESQRAA